VSCKVSSTRLLCLIFGATFLHHIRSKLALIIILSLFLLPPSALTPPAHYPKNQARAKLAFALFLPILVVTAVVPARIFAHCGSFAFGVGFFAQPLLIRAAKAFVRAVPDWQEQLDLRK